MIDEQGFRQNVGIILINDMGQVFWAKRIGQDSWQFPQGGINQDEYAEEALFRELYEEIGLQEKDVTIIGQTKNWLRYRIPERLIREQQPVCVGQKQLWFLLKLIGDEKDICFNLCEKPEFDDWQWVSYWYPVRNIVSFKREVYRRALKELAFYLPNNSNIIWRSKSLNHILDN